MSSKAFWMLMVSLAGAGCGPAAGDEIVTQVAAVTLTPTTLPTNASAAVPSNLSAGDLTVPVGDSSPFSAGDLAVVIQAAGAHISTGLDGTYGSVTDLGGAGTFELVRVASVSKGALKLAAPGLRHAYPASAATQVVRVPELDAAVVPATTVLAPAPWDGTRGGVFALAVRGVLQLDGAIDATAAGFRGGSLHNQSQFPGSTTIASTDLLTGAEKGESIVGPVTAYDQLGGRYGRGAPANAGGGGDAHNAGGGGGANVGATLDWDGLGVPEPGGPWQLESVFALPRPARPSGGGRGGYTYSQVALDPLTIPPGDVRWGGDSRRSVGGLGGHPLAFDGTPRLVFGGGGGAGDANNLHGGRGGRGGGIIIVFASQIAGKGTLRADGEVGQPGAGFDGDAPGGGGGGGSILLFVGADPSSIVISARGGVGGLQDLAVNPEAEGPGGGGGGGLVALRGTTHAADVGGGLGGLTNSPGVTAFPYNGATAGGAGRVELVGSTWTTGYTLAPTDAGTPVSADAGSPRGTDAGAPTAQDAGTPRTTDAGTPRGTDAAAPSSDGGTTKPDAAAKPPRDAQADSTMCPPTNDDGGVLVTGYTVTGGACSAAPGPSRVSWPLLFAFALLLARGRRRRLVIGAAVLAGAVPAAHAAPDAFNVEWVRLPADRRAILDTEAEVGTPAGSAVVGVWGGWSSDPLVLRALPGAGRVGDFVRNRVDGGLGAQVGVASGWAIEVELPIILYQKRQLEASDTPIGFAQRGFGDVRAALRMTLWRAGRWTLVLTPAATAPTAREHSFLGESGPTFAPSLVLARAGDHVRTALETTYRARREVHLDDLRVDDDVALRGAAALRVGDTPLEFQASALLAFAADRPFAQSNRTQAETHLGLAGSMGPALGWVAGGGLGAYQGWGVPRGRLFAGLRGTFDVMPAAPVDHDGDGLTDAFDACPAEPEDRDGFQDADGCPDPDNDGDGIPDGQDQCPRAPETVNGFQDADGCPDFIADRDGDGLPDATDACPTEPEDRDGFQDADGCPDLDNDADGVWDLDDACPLVPGPADRDGCPAPEPRAETCGARLAILAPVYFRTDDATLDPTARAVLREVARTLGEHPEVARLRITGHTDADGGDWYNDELSRRRVASVTAFLIAQGIAPARLVGIAYGKHVPAADNITPVGKALNRRVMFEIVDGERLADPLQTSLPPNAAVSR